MYYVEVAAATFVSAADNSLEHAGIERTLWSFTTESNDAPVLDSVSPLDEATGVALDAVAVMTFKDAVQAGTGMIELHKAGGGAEYDTFDVNSDAVVFDGMTVSIDLAGYLEDQTTGYYIIVPAGAITNVSTDPEPYAGLVQTTDWTFSTVADGTAPMLTDKTPNGVTLDDNHPTFVMTFDENVELTEAGGNLVVTRVGETAAEITVALTADMISDNVVTVTYVYDANNADLDGLDKDTEYFVTVDAGALADAAGNEFAGVSDPEEWKFTTGDFVTGDPEIIGENGFKVYPNPVGPNGVVTVTNAKKTISYRCF